MGNDSKNVDSDEEISNLEKILLAAEEEDKATSKEDRIKLTEGDSSDEEEQRDFQSCRYNDFGRDINKKLKEKEETKKFDSIRVFEAPAASSFQPSPSTSRSFLPAPSTNKAEVVKRLAAAPSEPSVFCDPVFGLRIVQPLISSAVLKERMAGKMPVGVQRARFHTERGDTSKDWVIAGVLVTKSPVRTTQKGDQFSIWSISDLKGEVKTVTVFLFRTAHKDLWKTNVGTVIGILNPKVMERKDDKIEAALSVDNSQKVMILGQSKDLGNCKAKKNNGEVCGAIVNKTDCDFCIFHMKKEYSKIKRSEFQSSGLGRGLDNLRNKVLGKSEVFYAGQSFTAQKPAKKPAKMIQQDRERMMTLSEYFTSPYNGESSGTLSAGPRPVQSAPAKKPGAAASLDFNVAQRKKDIERLKLLQGTETPQMILTPKLKAELPVGSPKKDPNFVPKLSSGSLTFSFQVPMKKTGKNDLAKLRAAEILMKKPLVPSNPNHVKYRGTQDGKRKLTEELKVDENDAKKVKLTDSEETQRRKEYLMKMMNAKSSHEDLIEDKETERREKCFDSMEKKEAMEEKMANTTEMKVSLMRTFSCQFNSNLKFFSVQSCHLP